MNRQERLTELHEQLRSGVAELAGSQEWQAMLNTAARFHTYSPNNVRLIFHQRPDATRVMGFGAKDGTTGWKSVGRQVVKGAKAIWILAPCKYKVQQDTDSDESEERWELRGFKPVCVFDIADTEGDDLPDVLPEILQGHAPTGLWDALQDQVTAAGYTTKREASTVVPTANGATDFAHRTIQVRPDLDAAAAAKTLVHELAHVLLHHPTGQNPTRDVRECEAESVAYIVCAYAGLDTTDYSLPYVARWTDADADTDTIAHTATRVIETATRITKAIESHTSRHAA